MVSIKEPDTHSVAITGLSCRFPGDGDNLENFWESICRGKSAWSEVPKERFNIDAFHSTARNHNTSVTRGAHFIKQDVSHFDANFFSFSKAEAESMDPQHRMMIEVTYEALEKSGISLEKIAGSRTGVFMGHFTSDYREMIFKDPESAPGYTASGTCKTSLANRISWLFDLQGPSFSLDTACSSSLVALHLACQSLRTGESDLAIVGGVNLLLNPEMFMYFSNQHFLSPDGKCKSFDESGNGYGRGEGFAAVILKRADDAIFHGDPLRAIIRGSGSNQDGHTKGFTLPSADAQAALINDTYRNAGIDLKDTHYVEAHGTGTQAGDTEETEALSKTISAEHTPHARLLIGSVKSNIGHLEACAGLAGIVKSVLILEHGIIPPTIHYRKGNPKIKFEKWNLKVPITLTPWPTDGLRRISVNSFGYGGTNAHAVLDDAYHYLASRGLEGSHYTQITPAEIHQRSHKVNGVLNGVSNGVLDGLSNGYPNGLSNGHSNGLMNGHLEQPSHGVSNGIPKGTHSASLGGAARLPSNMNGTRGLQRSRLFTLSAQDREGLKRVKQPIVEFLGEKSAELKTQIDESHKFLADLAFTLSKRTQLQWRTFEIATSIEQLASSLANEASGATIQRSTKQPRIGFVFTGQGAQWPRMGMELMAYPAFRRNVEAADRYLLTECGCSWSAIDELKKGKASSQLHMAAYSQTLCTVLQVALVDMLETWNISPVAVAGHSSGEIGAAYCLGAVTREDALKIAFYRGLLSSGMKTTAPDLEGSMMAVGASPEKAREWISNVKKGEVVIACVNSPTSVTLSGDTAGIEELLETLTTNGIFARKLQVDTAYHSPHMEIVAQEYFELLVGVRTRSPTKNCTMHSSVTGRQIKADELGASNWVRNLTSPVQFAAAVYDMMRPTYEGVRANENALDVLIEIGPHSALQGPATQTLKAHGISNIPYYSVLKRNEDAIQTSLSMAGSVFAHGGDINISEVNNDAGEMETVKLQPLVDLPMYPWNHTQRYWTESRIVRDYRLRKQPNLGLIGAPSPSFAQGEHTWRKFIKLSEEPWVADHRIQSSIVYPGAGFLAMALEAAYQIADPNQRAASVRLRDVQLVAAAVIQEDTPLECIVHLRPHFAGTRDSASTWTEFIVTSSPQGQTLQRNCSGLLIIDYELPKESTTTQERALEFESLQGQYVEAAQLCKNHISPSVFYEDLDKIGLAYGPTFTNVTEIRSVDGHSFCAVDIPSTKIDIIEGLQQRPHIVHPGTLDAVFHLAFAAVNGGEAELVQPMVPRAIDEVVISTDIPFTPGYRLSGFSNAARHGFKEFKADIFMMAEEAARPVVEIRGFTCMEIGGSSSANDDTAARGICSKLTWKPAISILTRQEKEDLINNASQDSDTGMVQRKVRNDEIVAINVIDKILQRVSRDQVLPRYQSFFDWMKLQQEKNRISSVSPHLEHGANHSQETELAGREQDVEKFLTGQIDPSSPCTVKETINNLMLNTEGVVSVLEKLQEYLRLLYHTNPGMSILEMGTGLVDDAPSVLLNRMQDLKDIFATAEYTISYPNGDAVMRAQKQLSIANDIVKFAVLDIEMTPETQEVKEQKYDVVIVFNITGSVAHPEVALGNARKLLKDGGQICLIELSNPGLYYSVLNCSTSTSALDTLEPLLPRNGFKDVMKLHDFDKPGLQQVSLLIANANLAEKEKSRTTDVIIIEPPKLSKAAKELSDNLSHALEKLSYQTSSVTWDPEMPSIKGKACISLLEVEDPFLASLAEDDFMALRQVIMDAADLLWIVGFDGPDGGMVSGLARVIRNEIPGISFRTLHTSDGNLNSASELSANITRIFDSKTLDSEFKMKAGFICVSRVEEDGLVNAEVESFLPHTGDRIEKMPLGQASGPQKLCIQTPGMLDSLCFEADPLPATELETDQIEIDVKATALNFREIMSVMGQVPDELLGFDASGMVRRVGSAVTRFKIGDSVAMYGHGSHRAIHRSKADYCELIPEGLSFEQAATIPVVHGTAWYGLVHLARVTKGQSILIHAAAGGVGQSAIQIAQHYGMEVYATVGSETKRRLLRETYNVPDDHIFNSRDLSFVQGVKRMTSGRGVDVILNSLSGEALRQTWHCIAPFGTFLEIGIKDILNNTELDMRPFLQDATFAFFNLNHIEKARPDIMAKIISGAFDLQRRGITRPITPLTAYPISEVENAFRLMQTGKHLGKIALTFSDTDVVPVLNRTADSFKLDPTAVYVLVGGLGGLGRSLSTLFVEHGARKLCFLSRSGGSSAEAQRLLQDLQSQQVQVEAYACDIADVAATSKTITRCSREFGRIRGVVQCAMLLRDVLFTNMTYTEWIESTRPKVQGSWNLHQNLRDVDFFIILSSFAATFGNRGQSNYAAGGAYQDALAYHRRSQGLHAVTLDLGLMRDVGVLAEKGMTDSLREWEEPYGILEPEFHALLKRAITGDINNDLAPQVLTGLATGGSALAAGITAPFYLEDARFAIMARTGVRAAAAANDQSASASASVSQLVSQATSISEAAEHVTDALIARVAKMLQTPTSEIDTSRFLHSYGIDSLVAIEIVNWALKELKATLTVIDVMAAVPITVTAKKIASGSSLFKGAT